MSSRVYFAHSNDLDKSNWQLLRDHLMNTARIASDLGMDAGLATFAYSAALLHDIGKYSLAFQRRLNGAPIKIDHSTAGAQEIKRLFSNNPNKRLLATILAYCIAGHHAGLPDYGSPVDIESETTLLARLKRGLDDYSAYESEINASKMDVPDHIPIKPITRSGGFSVAFFTRMLYSILVDADFIETETFMNNGKKPRGEYEDIKVLTDRFNRFLEKFDNAEKTINQQRTTTLKACISKAKEKPGLFSLTVPTGGGKTFSSLAFALNHAVAHDLKRVIYVIPYTSIIEQNAAGFKKVLGEENVLEHHSNFDWKSEREASKTVALDERTNNVLDKLKLASENWDVPIVVTTNVQFFESLFANRSSRCRKLHNVAKSVMIFDEAQMLPRDYIRPCMYAVYELVKNYGASAVFCTATQPVVERFLPEGAQTQELAPDPQALYGFYKRVQVQNAGILADDELAQRINGHHQALCIVNTRKHAKGLFEGLVGEGRFHLSTLMCAAHRKAVIATIRRRLHTGLPCRVISTQIMEAGIDVDFPAGYRAVSGLDSIIQAAGRVNREHKLPSSELFVFEPASQFVKRTPAYIQQGADVARNILRKYDDPVCLDAISEYYSLLYDLQDPKSFDRKEIQDCFEIPVPNDAAFNFRLAAEKFRLIENNTVAVVIPSSEQVERMLLQARVSQFPLKYARHLQPYTVNIYEQEYQALLSKGVIDVYKEVYSVLNDKNYYDDETGLTIPESIGGEAIFFDG